MSDLNLNTNDAHVEIGPPKTEVGVLGWLKKNLFSNWKDTLVTIVFSVILYFIIKGTLTWVFETAEWAVISKNFKLYFSGQYPADELYRVWTSLGLVTLLFGFSAGIWRGTVLRLSIVASIIFAGLACLPFVAMTSRIWLAVLIVLLYGGFFVINKIPKKKGIILVGWFLSFPIVVFLLNGFHLLTVVNTNLWGGLLLTVLIAVVAIVCSFPMGILLALGRRSNLPIVKWFSIAYIELIRGIPLITVLFFAQLMFPLFMPEGIEINNVVRVMLGATLFTAAYMAENVRGGLQSIPRGQYEAATALGLSKAHAMTFVIMPQALRAVIPAIVGQSISLFKDTSLVAIVGLFDLLGIAKTIVANPEFLGKQMEAFLFIALIYWSICFAMSYASRRLEKNLGVGER